MRRVFQYAGGVACLAVSEIAYGAWMVASLISWWRSAPQAELARKAMDLLHDLKPALLAVERYEDIARPLYEIIEVILTFSLIISFSFKKKKHPATRTIFVVCAKPNIGF